MPALPDVGALWRRLRFYFRRAEFERELAEEMRFHVEMTADALKRGGASDEEARRAAARRFGNATLHRENAREVLTMSWVETLAQDLRYAARSMRRSPGFTAVAVLTLALGIGATTAIFTLVDVTLLKPLPYGAADRLVVAYEAITPGMMTASDTVIFTHVRYRHLRSAVPAFESVAAFAWGDMVLSGDGAAPAERLRVERVSASYFPTLGVQAELGRVFLAEEDSGGGNPAAVLLSRGLWARRFGSDPAVVGRSVTLRGKPFTVVGVMPADFAGLSGGQIDAWVPIQSAALFGPGEASALTSPTAMMFRVVARLAPGVPPERAAAQVAAAGLEGRRLYPVGFLRDHPGTIATGIVPLAEARRHPLLRPLLSLLAAATGAVLLIVCANLAGLMLARARARRAELGVRMALGAGRGRLARQALTESAALALAGGALGAALSVWMTAALVRLRPELPPAWALLRSTDLLASAPLRPDWRVLLFAVAATLAAGLLFGAAPAIASARADVSDVLSGAGAGRGATARASRRGPLINQGPTLVVAEVAIATALLVGAGLMLRSLGELLRVDAGFQPRGLVAMQLAWADSGFAASPARRAALRARVAALPGVESVGEGNCTPLGNDCPRTVVEAVDGAAAAARELPMMEVHDVTPGVFRALGVPLRAGRAFDERDTRADSLAGSPPVVIVNQAAARVLWPGVASPVGRRLTAGSTSREVVGVASDVHYGVPNEPVTPALFFPDALGRGRQSGATLFVRTAPGTRPAAAVPAIRRAIAEVEPSVAAYEARTMEDAARRATSSTRFVTTLLSLFAAVAALLAALGVYGVLAYGVAQRTREFGIRMALGAGARSVLALVLRQGAAMTAVGVAAGVGAALLASRALDRFLVGVARTDAPTLAAVAALVCLTGLLAAYLPARRATRVDPVRALRSD